MHYLWRAVDHEGGVLEVFTTKRRDRRAALKFLKRAMKRYGRPKAIVTDRLGSYAAAMKVMGVEDRQICGQWLNNRAENSHQPFRRRGGAMARFRDIKTLQKFAAATPPSTIISTRNVIFITAKPSNSIVPPPWPSVVNLQPERPRLLALLVRSSQSDNANHRT